MKNTSMAQERFIASLKRQNTNLSQENKVLKDENESLKSRLHEYEKMLPRIRSLEEEYKAGIQSANKAILACKQTIAKSRQMDKRYRKQVTRLIGEMKT